MKYNRFEDLPVWKEAIRLALNVYHITEDKGFTGQGDLKDQIRRAALSISNNIAEGFERGTTNELIHFLYIARGSAGEVRSMLCFSEQWTKTSHLDTQVADLKAMAESCSRQIRAWTDNLQNSEIKGQKFLNDKTRSRAASQREYEEMKAELDEINRKAADERDRMRRIEAGAGGA